MMVAMEKVRYVKMLIPKTLSFCTADPSGTLLALDTVRVEFETRTATVGEKYSPGPGLSCSTLMRKRSLEV
jgi:hypothetical protein